MTKYLRGNYELDVVIEEPAETAPTRPTTFEKKALSRLGGSICFVSKKGFIWKGDGSGWIWDEGSLVGSTRRPFERDAPRLGLANAEQNRPRIGRSVLELAARPFGAGDRAIVVAAGPSLHRRRGASSGSRAAGFAGHDRRGRRRPRRLPARTASCPTSW